MASYRYPRYVRHYGRSTLPFPAKAALVIAGAAVVAGAGQAARHHHHGGGGDAPAHQSAVVAQVIRYERAQLGRPYCWGGTGSSCPNPPYTGYDCSGLAMEAYASAGIMIPRTTETQWPALPHVPASQRRAGDLVYAAGADGTMTDPGHVGTLIGRNTVIQAYATGTPVEVSSLSAFAAGASGIVGYARPGGTS